MHRRSGAIAALPLLIPSSILFRIVEECLFLVEVFCFFLGGATFPTFISMLILLFWPFLLSPQQKSQPAAHSYPEHCVCFISAFQPLNHISVTSQRTRAKTLSLDFSFPPLFVHTLSCNFCLIFISRRGSACTKTLWTDELQQED